MVCYFPLEGFMTLADGFVMDRNHPRITGPMTVSCGQCIGCRLERSRQWAIRCVHETQMHADNCFITLTYDDDNLPFGGTLHRPDFQKFMKRLRKNQGPCRVFYCGEYGETTLRPHYHAILFGWRPPDPELFQNDDNKLYQSKILSDIWGLGHASFGEATFETAAYVARYVTKKITGPAAETHYETVDPETGEIYTRVPEFNGMSRRPGIGLEWVKKYGKDTYSKDEVILRGKAMKPPRAYDRQFEITDPRTWQRVKLNRAKTAKENDPTRDPEYRKSRRLYAGNKITTQRMQKRNKL